MTYYSSLMSSYRDTTAEQARAEVLERRKLDALYADFDALGLDCLDAGAVVRFDSNDGIHAALYDDEHWSVTGPAAPCRVGLEDFLAWLIRRDVCADDLTVLV